MRSVPAVVAPWVRTRLRAAPGAAAALALLVALTACLAGALPRAVDRYEDTGLRHALDQARPERTTVQASATVPEYGSGGETPDVLFSPEVLRRKFGDLLPVIDGALPVDRAQSAYGVTTHGTTVIDPWLPRPTGTPAQVTLVAQNGLAGHARVLDGRLPRAPGRVDTNTTRTEAAVSAATARTLHIKVGSVVHVPRFTATLTVRITGILAPRDPAGAYWSTMPLLRTPALERLPDPGPPQTYWHGALLLPQEATLTVLGVEQHPLRYWNFAPRPGSRHAHDLDRLRSAVASLESGPGLRRARSVTDPDLEVSTGLDDVVTAFSRLRSGVSPLVAVAAAGTATVAVIVLFMAGGLAADRRRTELALLRARGASLPGLTGRLLAETAVVAVPAGAAGLVAALVLLPGTRVGPALVAALAVTLTACAALPLHAVLAHRSVRLTGPREDLAAARPSRRRTVAELTLLALAAGAVATLRDRGTSAGQLVALAPVLTGVIAALLLLRLHPLLLRRLARPAGRLRGAVAPLSLARAGRTGASAVLPLLALLTALTTAAFGGSVLAGVADARDHAALYSVGADARLDSATPLPAGLAARVGALPGVRGVTAVSIAYQARPDDGDDAVPLVGADPGSYGRLSAGTGLGAFPAGQLREADPLPALASPAVARTYGTRHPFTVRLDDGSTVTVRITAVRDTTPAVPGADFLVVDQAGLPAVAKRPTSLLLTGAHVDAAALRRAAPAAATVRVLAEERADYADSPLQTGAGHVYTAAVAAGAGFAVVALLLALLRAAPERAALLARLRTMGLTRAQGRRLLILESLPQSLLAALGGALTGWAAIRLLSPGIDLTTVALATAQTSAGPAVLRPDPWSLTLPAVMVVLLAVGVAALQAWWTGRRGSVRELRAGEGR
ncbi:ABC transporter permease [Streptomyces collinus]|uniref:ABC transporter permease n=1 Tax=Streptomyces collinus TaxID=42684 RepID=UPI002941BC09|nr:ABC transporter permease [Streptomyces collinus]